MAQPLHEDIKGKTLLKKIRCLPRVSFHSRIDELDDDKKHPYCRNTTDLDSKNKKNWRNRESASFRDFFKEELTRGYMLEHDEERYSARRQKIYSFMRIPRDLEQFMVYGIMQCADSFLYIHTFLPLRSLLAVWNMFTKLLGSCLGFGNRGQIVLKPAEICDLLKSSIWIMVILLMISVDTNRVYHIIKSQSIIKLYIFYNMLEVGDRLLSAFGQDTIDALFWTATEPKNSKREHFGLISHIIFALIYVMLHSFLIMFQATTLNVAVNSNNKGLLTIMISNNFVELKGSVFKKFDKNNLFQLTCSDVRERFHLAVLLFVVIIQTMKEFDWNLSQLYIMLPDCFSVFLTEILIDWIKHAFITKFNELPECVYREYTASLAYDMTQSRQKHAFSDHSDLVARRMGFIPFPLGVVLIKATLSAVSFDNLAAWILLLLSISFIFALRICLTICALGKACKLMQNYQKNKYKSTKFHSNNLSSHKECHANTLDTTENTVKVHSESNANSGSVGSKTLNITQPEISSPTLNIFSPRSLDIAESNVMGEGTKYSSLIAYDKLKLSIKSMSELDTVITKSEVDLDNVHHTKEVNLALVQDFAHTQSVCNVPVQQNSNICENA